MPRKTSLQTIPENAELDFGQSDESGRLLPLEEDQLFHEINLLRVEGFYFCLDPKAAAKRRDRQTFIEKLKQAGSIVEQPITIEPHPTYGYPSVLAYKLLQAIMKKLTDYGYPAPEHVSFSKRELMELCGHASFGGWQSQNLFRAAMQLNSTKVWCSFFDKGNKDWQVITFYIVDSCLFSGRGEKIQQCVFHLHPAIIKSLNSRYSFCLNFTRMTGLEPIGAALFKRLFFHFSNLYSKNPSPDISFTKDYAAICRTWLGDMKPERYKSLIASNQLGRHMQALKQCGLIRSWEIRKNADKTGFNLSFWPGSSFFEDYHQFYAPHQQPPMLVRKTQDEQTIQRPMELVAYFYRRLYRTDTVDEAIFSNKETAFAAALLENYSFEDLQAWVDFALAEARRTGFDIRSFGGIRQYAAAFEARRVQERQHHEREMAQVSERRERQLQDRYQQFYRSELLRLRQAMGAEALAALEEQVRQGLGDEANGIGARFLVRVRVDQILVQQHQVPSFEQWQQQNPG